MAGSAPSARTLRFARMLNDLAVRAPRAWPLLRPAMRRFFDGMAADWDERTDAGSVDHLGPLASGLLHVTPAPERALDIGTGTGEAALLVAREFPAARVRGIDVAPEMVERARAKVGLDPEGRIAFKVADAASIPWPDRSFDLIVQVNVPPFFAEIARVLRPDGTFVAAFSVGAETPFYTPDAVLIREFSRYGIDQVARGETGRGSFWVGRLADAPSQ